MLFNVIFSLILIGLIVIIIKNLVRKTRPNEQFNKPRFLGNNYSFPSGHLASNINLFFLLTLLNNKNSYIFLISSVIIVIYKLLNEEHDLFDLLAAILIGFINSLISIYISSYLIRIFNLIS